VAIILVTICAALLALINIGSNVAFNGTISVVLEGFYISYFLAISLLFWRRVRGDMGDTTNSTLTRFDSTSPSDTSEHHLSWGPWRLRGKLGVVNNAVACCYLLLLIFFSFWPNGSVVGSGAGMNWAVLVTGVVMIFSVVYYVFYARKKYNGPIVEVDPHTL
jgi:choline transport protein